MKRLARCLRALACVWLVACEGSPGELAVDAATAACVPSACGRYACDPRTDACRVECRRDDHCASGFFCEGSRCIGTQCTPATSTCAPYACVDGLCATDCVQGPCAEGFYCAGDACVPDCVRRSDPVCGGYVCDLEAAECEPYCADGELPCAPGYACVAQVCTPDGDAPSCSEGCGLYACVSAIDRCATRCNDSLDCAASARCIDSRCVL